MTPLRRMLNLPLPIQPQKTEHYSQEDYEEAEAPTETNELQLSESYNESYAKLERCENKTISRIGLLMHCLLARKGKELSAHEMRKLLGLSDRRFKTYLDFQDYFLEFLGEIDMGSD